MLYWKAWLSHCLHSGNEAGWKKEIAKWHVLNKLLTQDYVSGISNVDASFNILRPLIRRSVCSPVSRNCERQQHVIRVLIAWCGVDVLTRNLPTWYNKTPITQKVLYSNIYGKTTLKKILSPQWLTQNVPVLLSVLLYSELKTELFMLLGILFHHLYSKPTTGSVPAGHSKHSEHMWHSWWLLIVNYVIVALK